MAFAEERTQFDTDDRTVEDGALLIKISVEPEVAVLELFGELDLANATTLDSELRRAERHIGDGTIIVDFSAVGFVDTTGLNTLVLAQGRADEGPHTLGLLRPTGAAASVLQITGLDRSLPFLD